MSSPHPLNSFSSYAPLVHFSQVSHFSLLFLTYVGLDVSSKLSSLRLELIDASCSAIVVSTPDEVSWLLNLRGNDVPNSPVMYTYLEY